MATRMFNPLLGKRIRVTELDNCGAPPSGGSQVVTDGFITLSLSAEVEEGTEIITKKANGALCVNEMTDHSFKRFNVEIEFCEVNPDLFALTSVAEAYENYEGDIAGFKIPEGTISKRFALELWTGLSGQACEEDMEEPSGYMLLPFVNGGTIGDFEVNSENAVTFTLTGAFTRSGNAWGVGPYDVLQDGGVGAPLPEALDPSDHLLMIDTGLAPPPNSDGAIPGPVV